MATLKTPRKRKSKVEIEQEFSDLVETSENERSMMSSKAEVAAQIQEAEVRAAVSDITVEIITQKLSDLSVEISKTLSSISGKMSAEVDLLKTLREAVNLETKELQKLHEIDIALTSMDQLISDYKEKKEGLEREMSQTKTNWEVERQAHEQEEREYTENLEKARTREVEEYQYSSELERKKLQDKFLEDCRLKEKENREKQELLEKGWKTREDDLKLREEELIALRKDVALFPNRLETECAKATKEATRLSEQKFNQEIALLKRDLTIEKDIGELKIKQLQELLNSQNTQMASLQSQLEEAKRQVQDIAVKAIESASGAKTLAHVNQIAIEQAKNRTPN